VRWQKDAATEMPALYALAETHSSVGALILRTAGDPAPVLASARAAVRQYDPTLVVTATRTMTGLLGTAVAEERFRALIAVLFSGAALVLAAVGLYALASRRVADRRREIAVRVALGARPRDVRRLVTRDALRTVAIGIAIGLPAAFAVSRLTQAFLFGVTADAPHTFGLAAIVLAAVALAASVVPARRAAAIDPMLVLKE
jgi:predicted lysophospholipase L1 biosynthesis ABC-type transport system permease subunit